MPTRPLTLLSLHLVLSLLLLLSLGGALPAVQPYEPNIVDPILESWRWRHIERIDGLSFQCMTQDANGVMWFGLRNGVLSYDGQEWRQFRRSDALPQQIQSIAATADGRLYALTYGKISQVVDDQ